MFSLAKDGMRPALESIWKESFDDSDEFIRLFFEKRYNPNHCAVYTDNQGAAAAMLHMLPAYITQDSEIRPVQYIYAAATAEKYRGKGVMTALLTYAEKLTNSKGQRYCALVPGSKELFKYYERRGYQNCFGTRHVYMNRKELATLVKNSRVNLSRSNLYYNTMGIEHIFNLRRDVLTEREGYISWDIGAVGYACEFNSARGGKIITATDGFEAGYAFCHLSGKKVYVSELISHVDFSPYIINLLLKTFPHDNFEICLPAIDGILWQYGEIKPFGMIKDVTGKKPVSLISLENLHTPYLGLALD